jgi:hypothetical protein
MKTRAHFPNILLTLGVAIPFQGQAGKPGLAPKSTAVLAAKAAASCTFHATLALRRNLQNTPTYFKHQNGPHEADRAQEHGWQVS